MQKYEVNDDELYPYEGTAHAIAVYLASDVDARIAERQLTHAPIARIRIVNDMIVVSTMYAPGLPDGEHDLYCAPVSERERIAGLENALRAYGGHKEECAHLIPGESWDCDCGFSALMVR